MKKEIIVSNIKRTVPELSGDHQQLLFLFFGPSLHHM